MLIPAAPSTTSLQEPNVVRIARLQAEVRKLESLKLGKNENDRATLNYQIKQREAEQLILFRQLPGHEHTKELDADFKAVIGAILGDMHDHMEELIKRVKDDAKALETPDGKANAAVNDSLKSQLAQLKAGLDLFPAGAAGHGGGATPGGGGPSGGGGGPGGGTVSTAVISATAGAKVEGTHPK